jgi:anti-anti-sigma factor
MYSVSPSAQSRTWAGYGLTISVTLHDVLQTALFVSGDLDIASAPLLSACLENQLDTGRRYGRIDLSALAFIDSTGAAAVLGAHCAFRARHGLLILTGVTPQAARVLRLLGVDAELMIASYPTEDSVPA